MAGTPERRRFPTVAELVKQARAQRLAELKKSGWDPKRPPTVAELVAQARAERLEELKKSGWNPERPPTVAELVAQARGRANLPVCNQI